MKRIICLGFYLKDNKINIGDELFKDAFQHLFPNYEFTFTNEIIANDLFSDKYDAIFIGAGGFTSGKPNLPENLISQITLPIFYIGVGVDSLDSTHQRLMNKSKLIAIRNENKLEWMKSNINNNTILISDIVFSLQDKAIEYIEEENLFKKSNIKQKILFLPNIEIIPKHSSHYWQHISYQYFKSEISQWLDESSNDITFLPMCYADKLNDVNAAIELINATYKRNFNILDLYKSLINNTLFKSLIEEMSKYDLIVTQRFHGIILSELINKPCISIAHHDKLKFNSPNTTVLDYYGFNKAKLNNAIKETKFISPLISDFTELVKKVNNIINL